MKWFFLVLAWLALLAAGVYLDLYLLLVGGIEELVHGLAAAYDGTQIAWGIVRIICAGVGVGAAILIGMGLTAIAVGTSSRRSLRSRRW